MYFRHTKLVVYAKGTALQMQQSYYRSAVIKIYVTKLKSIYQNKSLCNRYNRIKVRTI